MAVTLEDVKRELNITWNDEETDRDLLEKLKRAKRIIERAAGKRIDFGCDDFARQLLFDCIAYLRSNAFAEFKTDYADELLSLHIEAGGETNEATQDNA